jgi:protease-4
VTLRRWSVRLLAGFGAFAGLVLVAVLVARGGDGPGWFAGSRVGVIPLHGAIGSDEEFLADLERFRDDPSVKAIVVHIDSPGGSVAPSQSIYQELRKVRDEGIPVVASIASVGASGGYYVALAADSILALPGSITGSIGVIMELPNARGLLDRVGLQMDVVKSSAHKDIGSPFRPIEPAERDLLQAMISDVYDQFVEAVAKERRLPPSRVRELADGRILSGRQALQAGLVDRTGNLPDAIDVAGRMAGLGELPDWVSPPRPRPTLLDVFFGATASALSERLQAGLQQTQGPRIRYMAR